MPEFSPEFLIYLS
ncbi:hypothetical protein MC885_011669 [Smutsia gigantea]|nr:hypothetical protein MC885_011669 [Smutsia gigantea]